MEKTYRSDGAVKNTVQVSVIKVDSVEGNVTEVNPIREVVYYWTLDGDLIAKIDPFEREVERKATTMDIKRD